MQAVKAQLTDKSALEQVWLTIVALFILERLFKDKEDEWVLIAKKAKTYLKKSGISKPEKIISSLKIELL